MGKNNNNRVTSICFENDCNNEILDSKNFNEVTDRISNENRKAFLELAK